MAGLSRPTPDAYVLELTRQLAEDYAAISLPKVAQVVKEAAATATGDAGWSGTPEGIPAILEVIEVLAREELDELQSMQGIVSRLWRGDAAPVGVSRR